MLDAILMVGEEKFNLRKAGFWKSGMEITDANGLVISEMYLDKWYASKWMLDHRGKSYQLVVRNNPLAEWAIMDGKEVVLAYGLDTQDGKAVSRITSGSQKQDPLLDVLLWYLFAPFAPENSGDDLSFLMLIS